MSRYRIGPADLPYAREFMERPLGPASPGLQRVLNRMRTDTHGGKYVLVVRQAHRRWVLGRMSLVRGDDVELLETHVFDDRLEAERAVFRLRWKALTGEALPL